MRPSQRNADQLREIKITRQYTKHAEGSVLVEYGETKVLCTASLIPGVPRFLRDKNQGWLTAEYGMLPRATHDRTDREAAKGRQGGRTLEIQRLIGRALRAAVDLKAVGDYTIAIDCDVIQADGGTRTASITGGCVALADAMQYLYVKRRMTKSPFQQLVASISVGICQNQAVLDLDYAEDSTAETDMNVVMNEQLGFIEVQGTAENKVFTAEQLQQMLTLARHGVQQIIEKQREALGWHK